MILTALALVIGLIVAIGGIAQVPVLAHEEATTSDPPAGSSIHTMPGQVTITFTGEVDPQGSSATVTDASGTEVDSAVGTVDLDNPDRNTIVIPMKPDLPDGTYTVNWTNVSGADGHEETGSFSFTVDANAPESTPPAVIAPAPNASPGPSTDVTDVKESGGGISRGALIIGGVTIVVALLVVSTVGRRYIRR
jgi:methionine-rich copper-binding protein CopC